MVKIVICPNCGKEIDITEKHQLNCLLCGKNQYGKYPRYNINVLPEMYKQGEKKGVICQDCWRKLLEDNKQ